MTNVLTASKIELTGEQAKQIQAAAKILNIKNNKVLNYVFFQDSQAIVTDFHTTIIFNLDSITDDSFSILALDFNSLKVKNSDTITITTDNSQATITINNITKNVTINDYDPFQNLTLQNEEQVTITADYIQALQDSLTFTSKNESRPVLQHVLHKNNNIMTTDSHRLFKKDNMVNYNSEFILLNVTAKIVSNLFKKSNVNVFIDQVNNLIKYSSDNITVIASIYTDAEYPDLTRVMPENFKTVITFNRLELVNILSQAAKKTMIIFDITDNNISIQIDEFIKQKRGDQLLQSNLDITKTGDNLKIGFNTQYMLDALKQLKNDIVICSFTNKISSFVITELDSYHLILPIRLAD